MMKRILRALLVVCIFIGFYLFLKATDISESIRLVKQLGFNAVFIFFITFLAHYFGTLGWKYCIDSDVKFSFVKLYMSRHVGNIITLFNPSGPIAGEMFNANVLIRGGIEGQAAYKSVLLSRIIMTLSQLTILLIVLFFLSDKLSDTFRYTFHICFVLFVIIASVLLYLLLRNGKDAPYSRADKKWRRVLHRVKEMQISLAEYVRRCPQKAVLAFIAFVFQWVLASLELYFILRFSGLDVRVWDGLFMDTVIIISKSAFWFIPGQLGAEEIINKFVLYLTGISSLHVWLSVSILRRVRLLCWIFVAGIFYLGLKKYERLEIEEKNDTKVARLDLKQLLAERYPKWKLLGFTMRFVEKMMAVDKINKLFAGTSGTKNMEFIDACMKYLDVRCNVIGEENLPSCETKLIFASNHPQGGIEAICIASVLGCKYGSKIKFYANEFLCSLEPLKELFVPIYRCKQKSRENLRIINDFYKTDDCIVVFPAGVTSSKTKGKIIDHEWRKSFIVEAVKNRRNVVPLYFQARNSDLFYIIENFRRFVRARINFDVILFGHEFFKQRGKTFTLYIGKPVAWETFDKTKSPKEWASVMQDIVFGLPDNSSEKYLNTVF
jgi:hypothetical protein